MPSSYLRLLVAIACSHVLACGEEEGVAFVDRPTRAINEPDGLDFWDRPLPSDLRREADGTVDLDRWPGANDSAFLRDWFGAANRRLTDGWGVTTGVFVRLSGAVRAGSLPASASASVTPQASVFLLDVDPESPERGRRFPIDVSVTEVADRYTPANLLAAIPVFGFVRRERTRYALVVTTDVVDVDGVPIGRTEGFHAAFEGQGAPADQVAHFAPVRQALRDEGFELSRVAAAAVFTTFDHSTTLRELAAWAETLPAPALQAPWGVEAAYADYQVLTASFDVPVIQSGDRPYLAPGEGRIERGDDGFPVVRENQSVRLVLTVPRRPMPAAGFPLTIYMHGSGGEAYQVVNRGPLSEDVPASEQPAPAPGSGPALWLARRGVAALGFDFPLHGTRNDPPDVTGLVLYNLFGNVDATLDNFTVAAMELTRLSRLAVELTVDASLTPTLDAGGAADGRIRFDPERLSAFGQSMGTTIGSNWAAVDPRVRGLVFSGAGGMLAEIAVSATEPVRLKTIAELALNLGAGEEVRIDHPVLHALQNLWDLVEPVAKANRVVAEPFAGFEPRHVLMTAGFRDGYFHPRAQAAMAVAMGLTLVGDGAEPILPERLALSGRLPAPYPLSANVGGRTAGVVSYAAPNTLGHYVVFNQPGARHQYSCFLASLGTAEGAGIVAPRDDDAPCR